MDTSPMTTKALLHRLLSYGTVEQSHDPDISHWMNFHVATLRTSTGTPITVRGTNPHDALNCLFDTYHNISAQTAPAQPTAPQGQSPVDSPAPVISPADEATAILEARVASLSALLEAANVKQSLYENAVLALCGIIKNTQ